MKYEEGDLVMTKRGTRVQIENMKPQRYQYIENPDYWVTDENGVERWIDEEQIDKIAACRDCSSTLLYHDNEKEWICPFCQ